MGTLQALQHEAQSMSILYVEDNQSLQENAAKLLKKFFGNVYIASDGLEGLKLFHKYRPDIVITDLKMPHMSGIEMSARIRHSAPDSKIIFMSAFDEKEYLFKAIELGIFRFIKKPVKIDDLSSVLHLAIKQIEHEKRVRIFQAQLGSIFNYQSSMIAMFYKAKPLIVNQPFYDFYGVEDLYELTTKYPDIGSRFLSHEGFLYNNETQNWQEKVLEDKTKIYNVKMQNNEGEMKHFILKCRDVPTKKDYSVLSFDDVTELNLLELFDTTESKKDQKIQNKKALFDMLKVLQRNNAKISLHNYYKGIGITNDAVIFDINEDNVILKTSYTQQKAIQHENKTYISSSALPQAIQCDKINQITFEKQSVSLSDLHFIGTSPLLRETIRLVPEDTHQVTLFIADSKFTGECFVVDISLSAVRLHLNLLPAGLEIDDEVTIDMVFTQDKRPLIINTKAKLYKKIQNKHNYELVFVFDITTPVKNSLVKYIAKRQMAIIREFKGL